MPQASVWTYYQDGWWYTKLTGENFNRSHSQYKYIEVPKGRQLAMLLKTEHIITNEQGQIVERNSYGNDPVRSRG